MIIVNKEHNDAYNVNHITNIYVSSDGYSIKAATDGATRGGILGKYNSYDESRKAFEIVMNKLSRNDADVVYMPQDSEVKEKGYTNTSYHHITGKKTKGHGGS